jgi:hypothetical protein
MAKKNDRTILEKIVVAVAKSIWWLVSLPFRKIRKHKLSIDDQKYIILKHREIEKMAESDNMYELRHAVIEADKLVDYVLKKKGYGGETFADRLRNAEKDIDQKTYQNLWKAHKIRNQIAHEEIKVEPQILRYSILALTNYYV